MAVTHLLARLVHGSRAELCPDAGHPFWSGDYPPFVALVGSFLAQAKPN